MSMLVAPAGAKPVITVNYGSNLNNNGGGQPSTAASWVQYANVTNNYGIKYWEIGNEIVGNGYFGTSLDWEYDLHDLDQTPANRVGNPALSPTAYGTNAAAFIKAMKAVDPTIKCGIGVFWQSWLTTYDRDVLTAISNALQGSGYTLDFVIYHWYPGGARMRRFWRLSRAYPLWPPSIARTSRATTRSATRASCSLASRNRARVW